MDICRSCKQIIRRRQQVLKCVHCLHFQHRICGSGMSQEEFFHATKEEEVISRQSCEAEQRSREPDLAVLEAAVMRHNLEVKMNVPYDGNCLFSSVAALVPGNPSASQLRFQQVAFLTQQDEDSFWRETLDDGFLGDLGTPNKECDDSRVIEGLCQMLGLLVAVYSVCPTTGQELESRHGCGSEVISIGHIMNKHFVPLIPMQNKFAAVPRAESTRISQLFHEDHAEFVENESRELSEGAPEGNGHTETENTSFIIPQLPIEESQLPEERTVEESNPRQQSQNQAEGEPELVFEVVQNGSKRGKKKLTDNKGFSYSVKRETPSGIYWRCVVRNRSVACKATVIQRGQFFVQGQYDHCHAPDPGIKLKTVVSSQIKEEAKRNVFKPASKIVEDALIDQAHYPVMPRPENLVRIVNRAREVGRPKHPKDLNFDINQQFVPREFLRADLKVDDARHLLFTTDSQLEMLARSRTWYMDGTFKVVKDPFQQLFSIHAFVKSDDDIKQVPLVFVLMSRRKKKDYAKVLSAVKEMIPEIAVQGAVADFERGLWKAFRQVFGGDIHIKGCVFHWSQAVWRHAQSIGLQQQYMEKGSVHRLIRKVYSLPFLPANHIIPAFEQLREQVKDNSLLTSLMEYIQRNWLDSSIWKVEDWSIFGRAIRTINDVEGWHYRLNCRATNSHLNLYVLIELLHREAKVAVLFKKLASEGKLTRHRRKKFNTMSSQISFQWDEYKNGTRSASKLLKAVGRIYGPNQ